VALADEKVKPSTARATLVRITAARYLTGLFEAAGSNWRYTFGFPVAFASLRRTDGSQALTRVADANAISSNFQYSFDEATGQLDVRMPAGEQLTEHWVLFHYLFVTDGETRYWHEDPENTSSTMREWEPRLAAVPAVRQTIRDITEGIFEFAETTVSVNNNDLAWQKYFGTNDSFFRKDVRVWQALNGLANARRVFGGRITAVPQVGRTIELQVYDDLYALADPATMGRDVAGFTFTSTTYASLFPGHEGRVRHLHFGTTSWYRTTAKTDAIAVGSTASPRNVAEALPAACAPYSAQISTSNNMTWLLGMIRGSLPTQSFGTLQAVNAVFSTLVFLKFSSYANLNIGDTFKWVESGTHYATIVHVGAFTYGGNDYNVVINNSAGGITTAAVVQPLKAVGVFMSGVFDGILLDVWQGLQYSVTETADGKGNTAVSITFDVAITSISHGTNGAPIDPSVHDVFYRISSDAAATHGSVVQALLEKAGVTVDAASVTAANAAAANKVAFSIPAIDEQEVGTYARYVGEILRSMLSYLRLNAAGAVEYKLFAAPSSSESRDPTLILGGGLVPTLEYQDLATTHSFHNPHHPTGVDAVANQVRRNDGARWLHDTARVDFVRHCLAEEGYNTRFDTVAALLSRRRVRYDFETATEDIDRLIGDDLQLDHAVVLGGGGSRDVKVLAIERDGRRTRITAADLVGL